MRDDLIFEFGGCDEEFHSRTVASREADIIEVAVGKHTLRTCYV